MKISSKEQYETVVDALRKKGYTVDTVYEALESAGFNVQIKGELYEGIYASRVIAMMHSRSKASVKPLKL